MTSLPPDTPRLRFRALNMQDVAHLQVIFGDPVAMRHYPALKSVAETREWIERSMASYARHGHGLWAVCLRETGEFLGQCGLLHQEIRGKPDKEIGYFISAAILGLRLRDRGSPRRQGRGLADLWLSVRRLFHWAGQRTFHQSGPPHRHGVGGNTAAGSQQVEAHGPCLFTKIGLR